MALGLNVEAVITGVADAFRREFESDLRSRLMAVAEAEIEFIVKETADRVCVSVSGFYNQLDKSYHLNQDVRITDARTSQKPVHR
ncbi:hypothetical protein FDH02_gp09 [Pseudomonas phage VSW-3]|uniref:Uncharacterized protein n=1 Tax=Pseudomonas phage VSW-3 TaxID=1852562 RepID=A0A173GCY8_9CAUD|nr:hypothetical protein FDH02_gp09 [Pseudomonas phage VSW-3]ANH51085.1 hypothetical protein VSW3_9 [Pseudomonas phage VSW-3]